MSKMSKLLAGAGLVAATMAAIPAVQASDGTIYAGGACEPWSGARSIFYGMSINNSATAKASLDCPIARQETERTLGSSWVRVIDQNPNPDQDVVCEYVTIDMISTSRLSLWSSGTQKTEGSSESVQTLRFGAVPGANNNAAHLLSCSLPTTFSGRWSSIASYKTEENN